MAGRRTLSLKEAMMRMQLQLKPLAEQVIVITGASSGIGLVTAKKAARRGAQVVLGARNDHDLADAVDEIRTEGGRALYEIVDVSDPQQVDALADIAMRAYGRIDTWVNNAAVSVYGRIMELDVEDMRRQMDVNFWGSVYGSRTAVRNMEEKGGALINVASALADRAIPLQGIYCASKHALKAFTDTLRMELAENATPISVSLVKPGSVATPLFEKSRTLLGVEPRPAGPVYAPDLVADAILECATRPVRDVVVGGSGKALRVADMVPRIADRMMERRAFTNQMTDQPITVGRRDNLYEPVASDGGERGHTWDGRVMERSAYTAAVLHPGRAVLAAAGAGLAIAAGASALRRKS